LGSAAASRQGRERRSSRATAAKDPKGTARVAELWDLLEVYSHVASAVEQPIK
jgi:hypothetical protein